MRKFQPVGGIRNPNHLVELDEYLGAFGYAGPEDLELSNLEWRLR